MVTRTSRVGDDAGHAQPSDWARAWQRIRARLPRLQTELTRLASAHRDRAALVAERFARAAAAEVLRYLAIASLLASGTVLALVGIAGGLAVAFGDRAWLANLVTGGAAILGVTAFVVLRRTRLHRARMQRLRDRYARFDTNGAADAQPGAEHGR